MHVRLVCLVTLFTLSNAHINPRLDLEIPPEVQSLADSAGSRASSAMGELQSVFSSVASSIPSKLKSDIQEILPTDVPGVSSSGAVSNMAPGPPLVHGAVGVAAAWHLLH
ncbi:hypothetical protein BS50DRAFT_262461 [Corynespora cassiicola Philippines]|uniref:Uncharacterized protein n=1 Tax=Corynespora cassiicola Philippines TaxID=1448308 RepID=A0A2T2N164_CORCC|nr:hypothetical protein BS50DRAFT_262461 [Corynespora cassiicola Philippines]